MDAGGVKVVSDLWDVKIDKDQFSGIAGFLGAYFNQDWMVEYEAADDVIKAFMRESCSKDLAVVGREISKLLSLGAGEKWLRHFLLNDMSCYYCYWNEWSSGEAWLKYVEALLVDYV